MLRELATPEMVAEWMSTWENWRGRLSPNRKSGAELVTYLRGKYPLRELPGECHIHAIRENVLENEFSQAKLAPGETPRPAAFVVEDAGAGRAL